MIRPSVTEDPLQLTTERCAEAMASRWRAGDRPPAEEYFDAHPVLWTVPEAALELLAEELVLRDECGEPVRVDELIERFPQWAGPVTALAECHLALGSRSAATVFPTRGEWLGDFFLRSELGKGAHGRVYLATQPVLADRPVVLKVGPDDGAEHLSLARLQHTHIVPLYSVHEFPDRGLRALCMPYFGGKTLAAIQSRLGPLTPGSDWLAALGAGDPALPALSNGPALRFLSRASFPDAVCWIGACLADALQDAHDHGLVHLDLKPSNVLIAADGVPMLLDFHLARPPIAAGETPPGWLGGTPGFMAPEQEAAVAAVRAGRPVPDPVDGRADVFALGLLLRGLFDSASAAPSRGVADILARCTATGPSDRYSTAAAVARDLRRHLADLPLKGVPNRSVAERFRKWRRRRPYAAPLLLSVSALLVGFGGFASHAERLADRAEAARRNGRVHLAAGRFNEARESFRNGQILLAGIPFHDGLRQQLRSDLRDADRVEVAGRVRILADRARLLFSADNGTAADSESFTTQCRDIWDHRDEFRNALSQPHDTGLADLLDVGLYLAEISARRGNSTEALSVLDEAEVTFGPTAAVACEMARHARAAGRPDRVIEAERSIASRPPTRPWEFVLVGRSLLAAGQLEAARSTLDRAAIDDPQSLWANHYRGTCLLRLDRPVEAAAAFSACVALAPTAPWCRYNRGLAFLAAERVDAARADFDRVLELDPGFTLARKGREETVRKKKSQPSTR